MSKKQLIEIKKVCNKSSPYFMIFILSIFLVSGILIRHAFWGGIDSYFHMNAFYEAAEQIKTGHFSYFLSLFAFNQSGRIVNALYGPIFSYLGGLLLLICGSWLRFQAVLFLITLTIGGIGTYWTARKIHISRTIALIVVFLYLTSHSIMIGWLSNSEYTGLGALLLPFALIASINLVQRRQIRIVPLTILMTIYLQIHLLTSLIAVLILIPAFLIGLALSRHRYRLIGQGSLALGLTILLSGNVIGALYDVFSSNHLVPTAPSLNLQTMAGAKAIGFQNFQMPVLGPVYTLILIITGFYLIDTLSQHTMNATNGLLFIECYLFFWLSSIYFPWNHIGKLVPSVFSIVQFPQRFVSVGVLTSLLIVGKAASVALAKANSIPIKISISILIGLILLSGFTSAFHSIHQFDSAWTRPAVIRYYGKATKYYHHNPQRIRNDFRNHNLASGINVIRKISPDYMPTPQPITVTEYQHLPIYQTFKRNFINHQPIRFHIEIDQRNQLALNWRASKSHQLTRIPLVAYQNTMVQFNHHLIHPQRSIIGTLLLKSRTGNNHILITYRPGIVFKLMSILTIISWLAMIILLIIRLRTD